MTPSLRLLTFRSIRLSGAETKSGHGVRTLVCFHGPQTGVLTYLDVAKPDEEV
jgi:hypothetical protein